MSETEESGTMAHYVCQTYIAKTTARGQQGNLQIDKQLQYSTPHEAQERAEREFRAENCIGAHAYMVIEDSDSGEVGDPTFLAKLGFVPEQD